VPDKGKQLTEFSRTAENSVGLDLKVASWGTKGQEAAKYTSAVPGDIIQTFRNFTSAVVELNNRTFSKRESVLILLDEFDVIKEKQGLGSLIKTLSSDRVKFGICGIRQDLSNLIADHASVGRLSCSLVIACLDHMLGPGDYSDAFASAFIAPINPEIFRRRSIASAV
jgi:hypothetical protein